MSVGQSVGCSCGADAIPGSIHAPDCDYEPAVFTVDHDLNQKPGFVRRVDIVDAQGRVVEVGIPAILVKDDDA